MRVLVCGDRNWNNQRVIQRELAKLPRDTVIIHGAARGADRQAGALATLMWFTVESYPAQWDEYGRAAGPIRNQKMLDSGIDLVLAFHNDITQSKGTADMVRRAKKKGVEVRLFGERDAL